MQGMGGLGNVMGIVRAVAGAAKTAITEKIKNWKGHNVSKTAVVDTGKEKIDKSKMKTSEAEEKKSLFGRAKQAFSEKFSRIGKTAEKSINEVVKEGTAHGLLPRKEENTESTSKTNTQPEISKQTLLLLDKYPGENPESMAEDITKYCGNLPPHRSTRISPMRV